MDSSTATFISILVVAFIVLKWFMAPSSTSNSPNQRASTSSNTRGQSSSTSRNQIQNQQFQNREQGQQSRAHRQVTQDMIEVVQSLAPQLSIPQIRYDLERSGSVEATVERYLTEGGLPSPPNLENDVDGNIADKTAKSGLFKNSSNSSKSTSSSIADTTAEKKKIDCIFV
ncbi:hypothetical protein PACTADRAFT_83559 [Pachysolen tannophilus NRRL Y-2460]|uniref:Coupling of ubiquitin conjugation to ER degradation protein 1 n=1 Tax=Pachysolen tannophilus NRRL Y-2460 TaxID=669874 RepID=A0A1E4U2L6_PACTA|nr:hypothetical protein PACTADRAFT_83559 [Pachysolen tannophilus NRRL Y-2460]